MTYAKATSIPALLLSLLLFSACDSSHERAETQEADGDVVAVVGDRLITRAAFEAELNRRARGAPGRYEDAAARAGVLETMIDEEALIAMARAEGFDRTPEMSALIERVIAGRFRESKLAAALESADPVGEADIAAYYDRNPEEFTLPASVRAGVIRIECSTKATPERRAEARARAEQIRAQAAECSTETFQRLVLTVSDDQATRYTGGDTGWLTRQDPPARWSPELIEAAFGLSAPGGVAPLVETSDGFHIVRLTQSREASIRSLEEVRDAIAHHLSMQRATELQHSVMADVKDGLNITINQSLFESIQPAASVQTAAVPDLPAE